MGSQNSKTSPEKECDDVSGKFPGQSCQEVTSASTKEAAPQTADRQCDETNNFEVNDEKKLVLTLRNSNSDPEELKVRENRRLFAEEAQESYETIEEEVIPVSTKKVTPQTADRQSDDTKENFILDEERKFELTLRNSDSDAKELKIKENKSFFVGVAQGEGYKTDGDEDEVQFVSDANAEDLIPAAFRKKEATSEEDDEKTVVVASQTGEDFEKDSLHIVWNPFARLRCMLGKNKKKIKQERCVIKAKPIIANFTSTPLVELKQLERVHLQPMQTIKEVATIRKRVPRVTDQVSNIKEEFPRIEEVATIKKEVPNLFEQILNIEEKVSSIKEEFPSIGEVATIKKVVPNLIEQISNTEEKVSNIKKEFPSIGEVPTIKKVVPNLIVQIPNNEEKASNIKIECPIIQDVVIIKEEVPHLIDQVPNIEEKVSSIKDEFSRIQGVTTKEVPNLIDQISNTEEKVSYIKEEVQSIGEEIHNVAVIEEEGQTNQPLQKVKKEPIPQPTVHSQNITILDNILLVKPPTPCRKRKNDFVHSGKNQASGSIIKKLKLPSKANNLRQNPQNVGVEKPQQQQRKTYARSKEPIKKQGRPRKTETQPLTKKVKRSMWIEKLFGFSQDRNPQKKKAQKAKNLRRDSVFNYKLPKNALKQSEVITRSKATKLTHKKCTSGTKEPVNVSTKNQFGKEVALGVPKPLKTEPNNYELLYPIAEMLPQPIIVQIPNDKSAAKINAEMIRNIQPQLRLRRVPIERLLPVRSGGFYVPYDVRHFLNKKIDSSHVKKPNQPTHSYLPSIKLESDSQLRIEKAYSLNPVVRIKRLKSMERDKITIKNELLNGETESLNCSQIRAETVSCAESYSPLPLSIVSKEDNDDSGISMDDCDGQSSQLLRLHELLDVAQDEAMLLEIATQRAHINNCLLKFGFSPIQFHLYNSIDELKIFLDYLLVE